MLLVEDDRALLERFAQTRDEAAFAEIVRRHAGMVYSAARRQVADAHIAEDVTQAVFILLAQKAKSISPRVVLAGWLYNAGRMTAANARRGEQRRMRIEQKASEIMAAKAGQTIDWPAMEQQLDGAMSRLKS